MHELTDKEKILFKKYLDDKKEQKVEIFIGSPFMHLDRMQDILLDGWEYVVGRENHKEKFILKLFERDKI